MVKNLSVFLSNITIVKCFNYNFFHSYTNVKYVPGSWKLATWLQSHTYLHSGCLSVCAVPFLNNKQIIGFVCDYFQTIEYMHAKINVYSCSAVYVGLTQN